LRVVEEATVGAAVVVMVAGWNDTNRCRHRTVRVFRQEFTLEDAIGSHVCSLEARAGVRLTPFLSGVHFSYMLAR
jgi:hypothetical protein